MSAYTFQIATNPAHRGSEPQSKNENKKDSDDPRYERNMNDFIHLKEKQF
jgi:hypothetical protein